MPLTEEAFTKLVDAGCASCASKKLAQRLVVRALVAQKIPLFQGEPHGLASWAYKGEDLVRGTYRVTCDGCQSELFSSRACPLCDSEDGVQRALEQENAWPLPASCAHCDNELITATAYVPVTVVYEGGRAQKARTQTAPEDPGFHSFRVECKECRRVDERRSPCPLCAASKT